MHIVLLEWNDAQCSAEWTPREVPQKTAPIWTIGVMVRETPDEVEIISSASIHDQKLQAIAIPKGWFKRIRRLHVISERDKDTIFPESFLVPSD